MDGWMDRHMNKWIGGKTNGWIYELKNVKNRIIVNFSCNEEQACELEWRDMYSYVRQYTYYQGGILYWYYIKCVWIEPGPVKAISCYKVLKWTIGIIF